MYLDRRAAGGRPAMSMPLFDIVYLMPSLEPSLDKGSIARFRLPAGRRYLIDR
jgi:hypothetical protein